MDIRDILLAIDEEIEKLQQAKAILDAGSTGKRRPGRPAKPFSTGHSSVGVRTTALDQKRKKRRTISAAGRARIAAAQKARWATSKKAAEKATSLKTVAQSVVPEKKARKKSLQRG
jgi:hypothetical protein